MGKQSILLQLDSDPLPSSFDAIVAIDSGVDRLLQYANVEPTNVQQIVHGAMFTRGPDTLHRTAIFIGGSSAELGEAIASEVRQAFFGPIQVSVMLDGNGSNTTAVAAILCASRHVIMEGRRVMVLGGTGPVGRTVARLVLQSGARVALVSRERERAQRACDAVAKRLGSKLANQSLLPVASNDRAAFLEEVRAAEVIFGCGAAGAKLLDADELSEARQAKVVVDLNAVPPAGIEGIEVSDKAVVRGERFDYGAIGVGGLKMKIHRRSLEKLFSRNDLFLDAEEIFEVGQEMEVERPA